MDAIIRYTAGTSIQLFRRDVKERCRALNRCHWSNTDAIETELLRYGFACGIPAAPMRRCHKACGIKAALMHSKLPREQRFKNLTAFRAGEIDLLISIEMDLYWEKVTIIR